MCKSKNRIQSSQICHQVAASSACHRAETSNCTAAWDVVDFPMKNWNQIGYQNGHRPMEVNSRSQIVVGNGIQIWPCEPVTFKPLIKFTQFHQMGEVFITNMCFLIAAHLGAVPPQTLFIHGGTSGTFRSHRKQSGCVDEPLNFTTFRDPRGVPKDPGKSCETAPQVLGKIHSISFWTLGSSQTATSSRWWPTSTVKNHLRYIQLDSQLDVFLSHISRCWNGLKDIKLSCKIAPVAKKRPLEIWRCPKMASPFNIIHVGFSDPWIFRFSMKYLLVN